MAVLILGKLGDACRKLTELEVLEQEEPENQLIKADIDVFKIAIERWPLADPTKDLEDVNLLRTQLKINFVKLKELELDVLSKAATPDTVTEEHFHLVAAAARTYLSVVRDCRSIIGNINALGSIGLINLADQDIPEQQENLDERVINSLTDREQCSSSVSSAESQGVEVVPVSDNGNSQAE